jgi:hypothetical protein
MNLHVPDPAQQKVVLQKFVQQGQLDPILQKGIAQDPSAFTKIVTDAGQKAAQNKALSQLEQIGDQGGLRLQDKAALQDAMLKSQVAERSNRQGIASDMARRGLSGSGFDVASQLEGQQGVADQNSNSSLKIAADAQQRALDSIEKAGGLATQYRNQDFGEQAQKASAADKINAFNTANLRDVNAANVGLQNQAQQSNLAAKQKVADQNTEVQNKQDLYNSGLIQQQFDNSAKQLAGATGQFANQAKSIQSQGENIGNSISNAGTGINQALTAQQTSDFWNNYFNKAKLGAPKPYDPSLDGGYSSSAYGSGYGS